MKVTDLTVTKLKHGLYNISCVVLRLGNPTVTRLDRWDYETSDLIVARAVCLSYFRMEIINVVGKDSWLHRCRTARPGDLVLSLRLDGASGDPHPAIPRKWSSYITGLDVDGSVSCEADAVHAGSSEWINRPFLDRRWYEWVLRSVEGME